MERAGLKVGMTKSEIENFLKGKGDYVQIDHLGRYLKEHVPIETKKFVFLKLAELYEKSRMFNEAAKMYSNAAEISLTFADKMKLFQKEAEFYVRVGSFDRAENAIKKAMSEANHKQQIEIFNSIKQFVLEQAKLQEKQMKRSQAIMYYERFLQMRTSDQERTDIKAKLMELYKATGKLREYSMLEKGLNTPATTPRASQQKSFEPTQKDLENLDLKELGLDILIKEAPPSKSKSFY